MWLIVTLFFFLKFVNGLNVPQNFGKKIVLSHLPYTGTLGLFCTVQYV